MYRMQIDDVMHIKPKEFQLLDSHEVTIINWITFSEINQIFTWAQALVDGLI